MHKKLRRLFGNMKPPLIQQSRRTDCFRPFEGIARFVRCSDARLFSAILSLLFFVLLPSAALAQPFNGETVTDVLTDVTQPAGAPVLIRITLKNTGQTSISYWSGGPGSYPDARYFKAQITDSKGKTRLADLSNGQVQMGSGRRYTIRTGQSVTLPAALEALPAGSYTIQVANGNSTKLTVKEDIQLNRDRERDILERVRQGEPFARHVAVRFPADSLTHALLHDLLSEERQVALSAATTLAKIEKMPADSGPLVERAVQVQLTAELKRRAQQTNLLVQLAMVAGNVGSDEALSAVLSLARSDLDSQTRGRAVNQLGRFEQKQATEVLRDLLRDKNGDVQFEAARTLAGKKDPAAIEVLLAVTSDKKSRWRAYAYLALANFPSDARAKEAIEKGLDDPEEFARSQAQQALRELRRNEKK
jgi:hypothetical protein